MFPHDDKDLDRLFREAAEHYAPKSGPSKWEHLESRLNKELPAKGRDRKRVALWLLVIVLLLGSLLVYMLDSAPKWRRSTRPDNWNGGGVTTSETHLSDSNASTATKAASGDKSQLPVTDQEIRQDAVAETDKVVTSEKAGKDMLTAPLKTELITNKLEANSLDIPAQTPDLTIIESRKKSPGKAVFRNQSDRSRNSSTWREKHDMHRRSQRYEPLTTADFKVLKEKNKKEKAANKPANDDNQPDIHRELTMRRDTAQNETSAIKQDSNVNNSLAATEMKKSTVKATPSSFSKWEFGIVTGPDFSSVGFKHSYKTGINVGAVIGYRFTNHWLISTGIVYTKKFYKVDGSDFYPPKRSWASYTNIDKVTGSCSMIEMPINIRYDFSYNDKRRFFASTGVSSYFMDKQDYVYSYWSTTGDYRKYPWKTDSNYNYIVSNINVSIGYEQNVGKMFSIQAEPYFKLPLQGLGYGDIKLNSYGMLLTIKYKPAARLIAHRKTSL